MASNGFLETVFAGGIRHANYFNGRLLSAQDLRQDGDAEHVHHRLLGQAAGSGIVDGLWVTGSGTILTVTEGLAVNRNGVTLLLGATTSFNISPSVAALPSSEPVFTDCEPLEAPASATARGAYLLVLCPVAKFEGRAPTKALNPGSQVPADCGPKWRVEGVAFRLIPLALSFDATAAGDRRRNRIAHVVLGSEVLVDPDDPLIPPSQSVLDTLAGIEPHHVPLAVLYWTGSAIEFVDNWAARRRVMQPPATLSRVAAASNTPLVSPPPPAPLTPWGAWCSDWRVAEAQARFLQFQDHVETLASVIYFLSHLQKHFRYLPPVCFMPIPDTAMHFMTGQSLGPSGGQGANPPSVTREQAGAVLMRSWGYEAIDLDTPSSYAPRQYFDLPGPLVGRHYVMIIKSRVIEIDL